MTSSIGADHSTDNQFVFGWPFLWQNPAALEHSQFTIPEISYTSRDRNNSRFVIELWTNFAKYGCVLQTAGSAKWVRLSHWRMGS